MINRRRNQQLTPRGPMMWAIATLAFTFIFCNSEEAKAQWVGSPDIYYNSGKVGIGTTAPDTRLTVVGSGTTIPTTYNNGDVLTLITLNDNFNAFSIAKGGVDKPQGITIGINHALLYSEIQAAKMGFATDTLVLNRQGGNVGIGTTSPTYALSVARTGADTTTNYPAVEIKTTSSSGYGPALILNGSSITGGRNWQLIASGGSDGLNLPTGKLGFYDATASAVRMTVDTTGNVGIGTTSPQKTLDVAGDINALGTISGGNVKAQYQDIAEWVPARRAIPAGTVVVVDAEQSNHVLPSSRAYDTSVAGVVSAKPGVILGEGGEGKVMVATTGRVRVKVDATRAPIRVGDLLVTSEKEGIAMRSQPLDLGGTPIHRPGTLIGKALEPLDKGVGEIQVLLSLQ